MSKIDKIIENIQKKPTPKNFAWSDLIKLLNHFDFKLVVKGKTGGSRRKFINKDKVIISLHEPHPQKELKKYQIDQILEVLKSEDLI